MERTRKEKTHKKLLRLFNEKRSLFVNSTTRVSKYRWRDWDTFVWVPVDKPKFIGWDTTVTLSEMGERRPDAATLKKVLTILKLDEPLFMRDLNIIKIIRRANKRYNTARSLWYEQERRSRKTRVIHQMPGVRHYFEKQITVKEWEALDQRLQKYFREDTTLHAATTYRDAYTTHCYKLSYTFPVSELVVNVKKAYSTHRGIPKSDEISREKEIEKTLEANMFYSKRWGKSSWSAFEQRRATRAARKAYKVICNEATKFDDVELTFDDLEVKKVNRNRYG